MTYEEFIAGAEAGQEPPAELSAPLKALWYAEQGQWDRAHGIAQDLGSSEGSWVHACLHREEGDLDNARYWYSRAGKSERWEDVRTERREIIQALL